MEGHSRFQCDVIVGGFPCQDISVAGKGAGIIEGKRSSLWFEMLKCISLVRPKYALMENIPALRIRGLSTVLGGLAEEGYNAEWGTLSAAEVGAPHKRERMFIIADTDSFGCIDGEHHGEERYVLRDEERNNSEDKQERNRRKCGICEDAKGSSSDNRSKRVQGYFDFKIPRFKEFSWCENVRRVEDLRNRQDIHEPLFCGTRDGIPNWMDRIKCCGNAVVPQVAEVIGRKIVEMDAQSHNNVSTDEKSSVN